MLDWKRFQERLPDQQEIDLWFKQGTPSQVGIALVTGKLSGVAVIDIDDTTGETFGYDSELKARSGRGGTHLFYRWREGIENRVRLEGDPVDVRGEGGYLILSPSGHPSGNFYYWLTAANQIYHTALNLKPFPKISEIKPIPGTKKYAIVNVPEGKRNDNLYRFACSLDNKPPADVLHAMRAVNQSFNPPLEEKDLLIIHKQAIKHNVYVPPAQPRTTDSLVDELMDRRAKEAASKGTGYGLLDDIIKGFLPGHLYALTGETNMGKTTVAANLAFNVSRLGDKVLYIALEPDLEIVALFASLQSGKRYNDLTKEDFKVLPDVKILLQEDCQSFGDLQKIIEANEGFDLVIVDHIGYFVVDGDYVQGQSQLVKQLALLAKKKGQAIMYVVHPHKRQGTDSLVRMNDISGTAAHKQDCTEVLSLERKEYVDEHGGLRMRDDAKLHVLKSKVSSVCDRHSVELYFTPGMAQVSEFDADLQMVASIFPGARYVD